MPPVHHLEIDVSDHPDVLQRIVSVCRRRACRIVSLRYAAGGDGELARVALAVEGPHAARVGRWLEGLVDVLAVRRGGAERPVARAGSEAGRR